MNTEQTAALAADAEFIARCDAHREDWIDCSEAALAAYYNAAAPESPDADTEIV